MAEKDLKAAIQTRIQKEKEDILAQARKDADQIIKQAQYQGFSLRENYLSELKKACLTRKVQVLSQATLETQKMLLEAKEKIILDVLAKIHNGFKVIRQDRERYKSIFKNLLQEACECLSKNNKPKVKFNPRDKELAGEIIEELKLDAQLETRDSISEGLELCDSGECVIILNTFESRLNKFMPQLRQEARKILFG